MELEVTARWATISDLQFLQNSDSMHLSEAKLRCKIEWQEAVVASVDEVLVGYLYLDTIWSSVPFIALIWVLEGQRQSQASSILNSRVQPASSILASTVRQSMSPFSRVKNLAEGLGRLEEGLASGAWATKNQAILSLPALDVGYRLVTASVRKTPRSCF